MTIKQFINKAIEGGAYSQNQRGFLHGLPEFALNQVWLDPEAWKAVGKVEGWSGRQIMSYIDTGNTTGIPEWLYRMHCMVAARADGKTIEDYLATL
jgi:hypothetical protein